LPAASLTIEEAELLHRLYKRGKQLKINMNIKSNNVGKCTSKNIIFDIKGSELPNEIVLLSGHIDSMGFVYIL
jgi:carboxypeptidase Q